jgi:hypothetical protein
MLAVTDDDGATSLATVSTVPMDVLPGLSLNPIIPALTVPLPVALLSSADFDATKIDTGSLRLGRGGAKIMRIAGATKIDLNGDKRNDLLLLFRQPDGARPWLSASPGRCCCGGCCCRRARPG